VELEPWPSDHNPSWFVCFIAVFQHWLGSITAVSPLTSIPGITRTTLYSPCDGLLPHKSQLWGTSKWHFVLCLVSIITEKVCCCQWGWNPWPSVSYMHEPDLVPVDALVHVAKLSVPEDLEQAHPISLDLIVVGCNNQQPVSNSCITWFIQCIINIVNHQSLWWETIPHH